MIDNWRIASRSIETYAVTTRPTSRFCIRDPKGEKLGGPVKRSAGAVDDERRDRERGKTEKGVERREREHVDWLREEVLANSCHLD